MNITAYAAHRGCSRQTVYYALQTGRIVKEPCGKIESIKADARWDPKLTINAAVEAQQEQAARRKPTAPPPESANEDKDEDEDDGYDYQEARARREHFSAELTQLKAELERGDLVPVADVRKAWADILTQVKTRLLGLPDRMAATVAAESDPHSVQLMLAEEVTDILTDLARDVRAL